MSPATARKSASFLLLSLAALSALSAAPAAGAHEAGNADTYVYTLRGHDVYSDGARGARPAAFTEGARGGRTAPLSEGADA